MQLETVRRIISNNSLFLMSANASQLFLRLLSTVVLTRILDPSAYGVLAIVATIQIIVSLTTDLGIYPYVVKSNNAHEAQFLNEVWTIRLIRGIINTLVIFLLAPFIAHYARLPEIENVIKAASIIPFLEALTSMSFATAAKEGRIKLLTISELIPAVLGIVFSIILCYALNSYWGVIIAGYISAACKIYLSYSLFDDAVRVPAFSLQAVKDIWAYSKYILPSSLISLVIGQIDKIVLARILPLKELGLYNVASNLGLAPIALVSSYSSRILYPIFSKSFAHTHEKKASVFYEADKKIRCLILFSFGLFCSLSDIIVNVLYDHRYSGASDYLFVLSVYSVISYVVSISNEALLALGHLKSTFYSNIVRAFSLIFLGITIYKYCPVEYIIYSLPMSIFITYIFNLVRLRIAGIFEAKGELFYCLFFLLGSALGLTFDHFIS